MYAALLANGYFLPEKKRCTAKFLEEVFEEKAFCPKIEKIQFKNVLHPPSNDQLVELLCNAIETEEDYPSEEAAR